MEIPEKTSYCWGCGTETRALRFFLASWLCTPCVTHLAPIAEEEKKINDANKTKPCISMDCRFLAHSDCTGEESSLWPDGTFSVRKCSCVCHQEPLAIV